MAFKATQIGTNLRKLKTIYELETNSPTRKWNGFNRIHHLPGLASGYTNVIDEHKLVSFFASASTNSHWF